MCRRAGFEFFAYSPSDDTGSKNQAFTRVNVRVTVPEGYKIPTTGSVLGSCTR